jgi:hypothetical protein
MVAVWGDPGAGAAAGIGAVPLGPLLKRASVAGSLAPELEFSLAAVKAKVLSAMRESTGAAAPPGAAAAAAEAAPAGFIATGACGRRAAAAATPRAFLRFAEGKLFDRLLSGFLLMLAARFQREQLARCAERARQQHVDGAPVAHACVWCTGLTAAFSQPGSWLRAYLLLSSCPPRTQCLFRKRCAHRGFTRVTPPNARTLPFLSRLSALAIPLLPAWTAPACSLQPRRHRRPLGGAGGRGGGPPRGAESAIRRNVAAVQHIPQAAT